MIKEEDGKFAVYSEEGKKLSDWYDSKESAENRLQEIEYFKNKKDKSNKKPGKFSKINRMLGKKKK